MDERLLAVLTDIYGHTRGPEVARDLHARLEDFAGGLDFGDGSTERSALDLDEGDSIVVTYADQFYGDDDVPLGYLRRFLDDTLEGAATGVHVLPFCPYSSDDGFSVIDYTAVDSRFGSWRDLEEIGSRYTLMADLVLNHCSTQHQWFQRFLRGEKPYAHYFITVPPDTDTSKVARPRETPLLTPFETALGTEYVWTTFSEDQPDLNYDEPLVLLEMVDVLLFYLARGVRIVRLDAVAYVWKRLGTSCIHLHETHRIVQLFRRVLELVKPEALLITETNVPHRENVSYFGDGGNESHMVYNFSLPPLVLDAFIRGDTSYLSRWAATLETAGEATAFFNFLASHDGIGLLPVHDILPEQEREELVARVAARGGLISYKQTPEGKIPYELNVTYLSAIVAPEAPDAERIAAFLSAHAIMLALAGVPGIYVHSLLGSLNWKQGVQVTGQNRTINRRKVAFEELRGAMSGSEGRSERNVEGGDGAERAEGDGGMIGAPICEGLKALIRARASDPAFHPTAEQRVIITDSKEAFVIIRQTRDTEHTGTSVLCVHSVVDYPAVIGLPFSALGVSWDEVRQAKDLIDLDGIASRGIGGSDSRDRERQPKESPATPVGTEEVGISLEAYGVRWLKLR